MSKNNKQENTNTFLEVPISDISTEGQTVRAEMDDDHVIELASSIARHSLLEPIVLQKTGSGYQLIAGFHRLQAMKRLNWKMAPANIITPREGDPVKGLALVENIVRKDMTLEEECLAVEFLSENDNLSTAQICDVVGKSREWVNKRLGARNMPDRVKEALFMGNIGIQIAEELSNVENEGIRNQILQNAIVSNLTLLQVREITALYLEAPSIGSAIEAGEKKEQELSRQKTPRRPCEACGVLHEYGNLRVVWVCTAGCEKLDEKPSTQ